MGRTLTFDIFRYNPQDPSSKPHMQSYQLPEHPRMNLFVALNMIREQQDPTLQFDFCCRRRLRFLRDGDQRAPRPRLQNADEHAPSPHHPASASGF